MTARPEQFWALVTRLAGEMKAMDAARFAAVTARPYRTADPGSFTRHPWVTERVTMAEAVTLTGHTRGTLAEWRRQGNEARRERGEELLNRPPALARDKTWEIGELAIWKAVQKSQVTRERRDGIDYDLWLPVVAEICAEYDARGDYIGKRLMCEVLEHRIGETTCYYLMRALGRYEGRPADPVLIKFARKQIGRARAERRPFYATHLREAFKAQGWLHIGDREARRIMREAAGYDLRAIELVIDSSEIVYPDRGGEGVPARDLVLAQQLADAAHVGVNALSAAVREGRLTCYRWTPPGSNVPRMLFHPERIELIPGYATPVDKGWRPPPKKPDGRVAANRKRAAAAKAR